MARTYEPQAASARKAIEKYGVPVLFYTEEVPAGQNPQTGIITDGSSRVERSGHGLVFGYKSDRIDNVSIQQQDAYVLYVGQKPDVNMQFTQANGKKWVVQNVDVLAPTSTDILYEVQVR